MSAAGRTAGVDRLLWTAAIVVGSSLPVWGELPLWMPVLLAAAVAWRIAVGVLGWPNPPRFLCLLLAILALLGVLAEYRTINGIEAGTALLVVMVALKFLESRDRRDQLVLIVIAYFLVFASLLRDRSLWSVIFLAGFVWLTTVALLQLGRRSALLPIGATARIGARLLLQAAPIMLVLFVLFPRLPGPLWGIPAGSSATSGLSDTMSPGDITALGLSSRIAFRAEFLSREPQPTELYWRGPVLSEFNGRTWSRPRGMRPIVGASSIEFRGEPIEYRVTLEPFANRWAVALDMPRELAGVPGMTIGDDYQLQVFAPDRRAGRLDYVVTSFTDYRARDRLTAEEHRRFSALPDGSNPRVRALVADWLADDPSPQQVIARAIAFFAAADFVYTLTPPALGLHAADEFLFETRAGFCEHYASAFAIMLRAAGLPARVVTGYQGGERNGVGGYYIVRQSDAHAWTEVWLADDGWVAIDPIATVAPARIELGSVRSALEEAAGRVAALGTLSWLRGAALVWDAANMHWQRWVLGYGPELQRGLLEALGWSDTRWSRRWPMLLALAISATALVSLALTIALARGYRARRAVDAPQRLLAAFARRLASFDVAPRGATETPAAYGRRAQRALPHAAERIGDVVAAYSQARYEPDADGRALARLRALVASFAPDTSR